VGSKSLAILVQGWALYPFFNSAISEQRWWVRRSIGGKIEGRRNEDEEMRDSRKIWI